MLTPSITGVLERPSVYRLWQGPFVGAKLAPLRRHNDLSCVRRVLDVGCGPGTNASEFTGVEYLGVDLSPEYVDYARRRHGDRFEVADVRNDPIPGSAPTTSSSSTASFTISTDDVRRRSVLSDRLTDDGHIHIIDLELPENPPSRASSRNRDRGEYPRPEANWRELFTEPSSEVVFEPFPVPERGACSGGWSTSREGGGHDEPRAISVAIALSQRGGGLPRAPPRVVAVLDGAAGRPARDRVRGRRQRRSNLRADSPTRRRRSQRSSGFGCRGTSGTRQR